MSLQSADLWETYAQLSQRKEMQMGLDLKVATSKASAAFI